MQNIHKITIFFTGLVLAGMVLALSFWAYDQIEKSAGERKDSRAVIRHAENLLSELKDAETGQRGYVLSGDEAYLKPYLDVRDSIRVHLDELHHLSLDTNARTHVDALDPLIIKKMETLANVITYYRAHRTTDGLIREGGATSKQLMDSIRTEIQSFVDIEETNLAQYEAEFQSNMRNLFLIIVAVSLLSVLCALVFAYLIYKGERQRLENVLHLKTQHLLEIHKDLNAQLQQVNGNLQVSEEKLSVTLNSIGDAVMATDVEGRVTLLNPLAERLTGWTQEEAAGLPIEDIFHLINQETRQPLSSPIKDTLAQGVMRGLDAHPILIARDGSEYAIADSCAPIRSRDGQIIGAVMVFRDVTERKEIENGLEKALQELASIKMIEDQAREYSESIINTVREPLIVLDQNLRVVTASRSFYGVFKVNPKETVGQLIYDLGNKQWDIPKLRELLETILPQKTTFDNYEVEHNFSTIGTRIMLLNARQIQRVLGKKLIILLAIEDITERRGIENVLEKSHEELETLATELKRTARVKSEFLANMSHELRTPLNSINGFSEVLYDETFGPLNEKQKRYVMNVLTSGKHLLLLINQILDMAKVEAGKMKLVLSRVSLKSLLNEISMLVADMVNKKNIKMVIEIPEDLPTIEADELKVKEIIYNLLSNAIKFTPGGGTLGMRVKKAESAIEIVVWDTGIGIAPENMEKIFEGFFRVDTPYSRVTEGTGLGLPLSQKFVELHGGTLSVVSEGLYKGTTVCFTLPFVSQGGKI